MEFRHSIEDQVTHAIAHAEFELHLQPIASITTGRIDVVEALVRWNHPTKGLLTPALFLAPIERSTASWTFSRHVLELAASETRRGIAAGHGFQIAVNVSAPLVTQRLATELTEVLAKAGIPPRLVILEITESAVMDDAVAATRALDQLAAVGLGVAIDDFGTGQSSLGRLRDLPIDSLKIDRSFVAELDRGVDPAFVRSIIELGHHFGLRIVAEGIEHEQTWRTVAQLGCDAGQGYWLSPPLPADELHDWLEKHDVDELGRLGEIGERRNAPGRRALDRVAGALHRPLAAHLAVSRTLDNWTSLEQGAELLLANLAVAMELNFGAFWLPQDSSVARATICHTSAPGLEHVVELTCAPGTTSMPALVNRSFVKRQPTVSSIASKDGLTKRDAAIRQAGLKGAIAIPAVCVDETFAVIELLSFSRIAPTERLLSALDGIGHELGRFLKRRSGQLSAPALTPRELEVLQLAALGHSAAAIAAQLYLSSATIKRHFESAYAALGVSDRASAVAEAMRRGLIT